MKKLHTATIAAVFAASVSLSPAAVAAESTAPAGAATQPSQTTPSAALSSTDKGSPAERATTAVSLLIAAAGIAFTLGALIQGALNILQIELPALAL